MEETSILTSLSICLNRLVREREDIEDIFRMIDFPGERLEELDIYAVGEVDMKGVAMLTVYCRSVCSISFFILLSISQSAQKSWDPWMFLST